MCESVAEVGLALSDEEMDRESAEAAADYAFPNLEDEKTKWVLHGGPAPAIGTFRSVLNWPIGLLCQEGLLFRSPAQATIGWSSATSR
jgi:hypothetical protein